MSDLSEIVDSLENRIGKLLNRHEKLKQNNQLLTKELDSLKSENIQSKLEIEKWQNECNSLKIANSMLGSDQYKRDTKLKINALVREIDQCIIQLSE